MNKNKHKIIFFITNNLIILINFVIAIYAVIEMSKEATWFNTTIAFMGVANIWLWLISFSILEKGNIFRQSTKKN